MTLLSLGLVSPPVVSIACHLQISLFVLRVYPYFRSSHILMPLGFVPDLI